MQEWKIPVVVAHGEGRVNFSKEKNMKKIKNICLQYVDNYDQVTEKYPSNPNGSPMGITGITNNDGRFTIMMPHPERLFLSSQNSWSSWSKERQMNFTPWMRMFFNSREWLS